MLTDIAWVRQQSGIKVRGSIVKRGKTYPAHIISKFDNDLLKGGGRTGKPLAPRSVVYATHVDRSLALEDAQSHSPSSSASAAASEVRCPAL